MPRRALITGLALACALALPAAASASTVGQTTSVPEHKCTNFGTYLQTGVASGASYAIPEAGTIISWEFQTGAEVVPKLELKVAEPVGPGEYKIVGASKAGTQEANKLEKYSASIPVNAGDVIGIYEEGGDCDAQTGELADTYGFVTNTNEAVGATATYSPNTGDRAPVSAEVAPAPVNTSPPTISGSAAQGQTLTEAPGSWEKSPTSYAYQWLRCDSAGTGCTAIPGAHAQSYVLGSEDAGHAIEVQEIATNGGGSTTATSTATALVTGTASAPPPTTTTTTTATSSAPVVIAAVRSGTAEAVGAVTVSGGKATIKLACAGAGPCKGTLKLTSYVTEKTTLRRHGKRRSVRLVRLAVIGTAPFSIADRGSEIVHVALNAEGRQLLQKAGAGGLRVSLAGEDVKQRSLVWSGHRASHRKHGAGK